MARLPATAFFLILIATAANAQDTTRSRPDSARPQMKMDDHMMGPWKEMNAFHRVMAATWHPASQKSDLAPLKARAKDLVTTADAWAASKAPSMPASCAREPVVGTPAKVAAQARALAALVESGGEDTRLKTALKELHDTFEVAEKGCGGHGSHGS
ncbi:MAG TPA: hypothetical protein VFZ73_06595 [Gemmatimonadaceae bacterium]